MLAGGQQHSVIIVAGVAIGTTLSIGQRGSTGRNNVAFSEGAGQTFSVVEPAPAGCINADNAHVTTSCETNITNAPATIMIWLRQSVIRKTTGSSFISPRRARIQIRISKYKTSGQTSQMS